jgi:hypothetical protein
MVAAMNPDLEGAQDVIRQARWRYDVAVDDAIVELKRKAETLRGAIGEVSPAQAYEALTEEISHFMRARAERL